MAYDEDLAHRIRAIVADEPGLSEKRMFGGLAFLVGGNMAVAASGQGGLLVRIDPADADELVDDLAVTRMEMRGKEMDGWLRVTTEAVATDTALTAYVDRGVRYAASLPPK
ncbi:TfoX/Sxy family protein [Marmoricola sp. RAF53]|uniref:TfoX/Sxy family protein n=1 Tax=Marmoricola sp. RAF53 TaxID=3233059 RepID=UPI003F952A27